MTSTKQRGAVHLDVAREQLPTAERELAEAFAAFEAARYCKDQAVRRYRKLRDAIEQEDRG